MCHKRAYARRREAKKALRRIQFALGPERRPADLSLPDVWQLPPTKQQRSWARQCLSAHILDGRILNAIAEVFGLRLVGSVAPHFTRRAPSS
jgi:hypothetical protein